VYKQQCGLLVQLCMDIGQIMELYLIIAFSTEGLFCQWLFVHPFSV